MNCLIVGANFYNKGAQLMLITLIERLRESFSDIRICVSPTMGSPEELKTLNIEILDFPLLHVGSGKKFIYFLKFGNLIKLMNRKYRGNVKIEDIDVVFDVSGFAFGEQWGPDPAINLRTLLNQCKKNKVKYILMPQAFGPFQSKRLIDNMEEVVNLADLIFARDKISLQHLLNLNTRDSSRVFLAPDITLFKKNETSEKLPICCIVPNMRMLDIGKEVWEKSYIGYLKKIINKVVNDSSLDILILVHDKVGGDYAIAEDLKRHFSEEKRVSIFFEENPVGIKDLISKSSFLIGSRFHALASALSTDVPCLGLGWSHKYKMLFEDFGIPDFGFTEPDEDILSRVEQLLDKDHLLNLSKALNKTNHKLKLESNSMWETIKDAINEN